jgi:hypothetical protein
MLDEAGPGTEPMKIAGPDGAGSGEVSLRRNPPARVVALRSRAQAVIVTPQSKRPSLSTGPFRGTLTMTYFRAVYPALSSARRRFTVLFGMGRRGTNALCSSEKLGGGRAIRLPPSGIFLGYVFNAGRSNRVV